MTHDKAMQIIKEEKIFMVFENDNSSYYNCKGSNNNIYQIVLNKAKNTWSCNCPNIRIGDCKHITAAKILKKPENKTEVNK